MIDLHTHSLLSDGVLLPSELVRHAEVKGYKWIAITDHADSSNIDFIIPRIAHVCKVLNKHWEIKSIPGIEITHVPLEEINHLVKYARRKGAKIVVGHGETISEPVLQGTNEAFIRAKVDILAHPGKINPEDTKLAKRHLVYLEITTRRNHSKTNTHVLKLARKYDAKLVLNTDSHEPGDLITEKYSKKFLKSFGLSVKEIKRIKENSVRIINS